MRRVAGKGLGVRRGGVFGRRSGGDAVERVGDGGVVSGGGGEGLAGKTPTGFAGEAATVGLELCDEGGVVGHAGYDGYVIEVLGRGADHGGAADVDVFDEVAERDGGLGGGLLESVEIDHDHVDGLDAVGGDGGFVFLVAANVEQATVDFGMEGLYAAIEHFGETGEIADVFDGEAGLAEGAGGAAGGDHLHAKSGQGPGKLHQAGLVCNAQQRTPNLFFLAHFQLLTFGPASSRQLVAPAG